MEGQSPLVRLLEERAGNFEQLKKLLQHQQHAMLENRPEEMTEVSTNLVQCLEAIHHNEEDWQGMVQHFGGGDRKLTLDQLLGMVQLSETEYLAASKIRAKLRQLANEITALRRTNTVLAENSLGFVRTLLRNILDSGKEAGVYKPDGIGGQNNKLINKRL